MVGAQRFNAALAQNRAVSAAIIQTVGAKGHDGWPWPWSLGDVTLRYGREGLSGVNVDVMDPELKAYLDDWRGQFDGWRGQFDEWRGQFDDWRGRFDEWRGQIDEWRGQIDDWRGQIDEWRGRVDARFDGIDGKLEAHDRKFGEYDRRFDLVAETLVRIEHRLERARIA